MVAQLAIPAFVAGMLMFFAPCTLPLVPGYLGFVGGVSRRRLVENAVFFILGFTAIFILFGSVFAALGINLAPWRQILFRGGGAVIFLFGLMMTGIFKLPIFQFSWSLPVPKGIKPGTTLSSLVFGGVFALGWTPCIGPVLGTILLLASGAETVVQGAVLLLIFSVGLAVPFLLVALGVKSLLVKENKYQKLFKGAEIAGGIILMVIGGLLVANRLGLLVSGGFRLFRFINYDRLLNYF